MITAVARSDGRAYYLDWVRIIVILILVPFHSAITFTTVGDCYIKYPQSVPIVDAALGPMASWVMPLLFVVAGAASFYALQRRTGAEYERERRLKLLIPFFVGFLLIVPPMTYLGARFSGRFEGSLLDFYPRFFLSGSAPKGYANWGHFWFLIYLYVLSMILLPLFLRNDTGAHARMDCRRLGDFGKGHVGIPHRRSGDVERNTVAPFLPDVLQPHLGFCE